MALDVTHKADVIVEQPVRDKDLVRVGLGLGLGLGSGLGLGLG